MKAIIIEASPLFSRPATVRLFNDNDEKAKGDPWFETMFDNVKVIRNDDGYPITLTGEQRQYNTTHIRNLLPENKKDKYLKTSYEKVPWYYFSKEYRGTIKYNGWRWIMKKERIPRVINLIDKIVIKGDVK
jgi:hypothetical protein